ncbi:MAG TPA: hypothetical protein VMS96_09140 [Terriglobales bacterium]|nr:hypothetical protein [Terriglobales bacterium]
MFRLKSMGVMSVGKMMAVIQGAIGLLFVPIFLIAGMAGALAGKGQDAIAGGVMLVLAVMMPVFYAGIGFVMGVVTALIYNVVAGKIGGIELELVAPSADVNPMAQVPR